MLDNFILYAQTGFEHILDPQGYDHILFVVALCAIYQVKDWKKLLYLVTAFTAGHSITLALATMRWVQIDSALVELLIPVTILLTCFINVLQAPNDWLSSKTTQPTMSLRYAAALLFGLIHGLGFSNFLTSLLGKEADLLLPLFAFNVGLEVGQLLVVFTCLLLTFISALLLVKRRDFILVLSGLVGGVAFKLLLERL